MALLKYWDGTQWVVAPNGAVVALDDLSDVTAPSPANDDFLQRKSGLWVNRTVAQVRADLATATAPITFAAGVIAISAATTGAAGSLSAADKAALDLLAVKDYCVAYHDTTQSIASGTGQVVVLNAEQADTAAFHDLVTTNARLTVPAGKGGLYLVGGAIRFNTAAGGSRRYLSLRVNGTTTLGEFEQPSTASFPTCFGATVVFLSATEYVEMLAFQDSGGAVNLINATNAWPKFWLVRLSG